jgi:isopenicillin N synthase-like dioxygenase
VTTSCAPLVRTVQAGAHQLPVVDLRAAFSPDRLDRLSLAEVLGDVCRDTGFFFLENHGISDASLAHARTEIAEFFRLPSETEAAIHIAKSPHHRGYVPIGEESALGSTSADLKEAFDIGRELPADDPNVLAGTPFHGPNVWPEARPAFRDAILGLYDRWFAIGARISALFAICFGMHEEYFVTRTDRHLCELRIVSYPPQPESSLTGQIGCGEHTDYGILSFLWQIDRGGLQLLHRDGTWLDVPVVPGTFVCILGDLVSRLTNDVWQATRHRVVNAGLAPRHSSAFFFDPNYDCVVEPLPRFVSNSRPPRYAPISMGEHMQRGYDGSFQYRATA